MKASQKQLEVRGGFREDREEQEEGQGQRTEEGNGEREQRPASAARWGGR